MSRGAFYAAGLLPASKLGEPESWEQCAMKLIKGETYDPSSPVTLPLGHPYWEHCKIEERYESARDAFEKSHCIGKPLACNAYMIDVNKDRTGPYSYHMAKPVRIHNMGAVLLPTVIPALSQLVIWHFEAMYTGHGIFLYCKVPHDSEKSVEISARVLKFTDETKKSPAQWHRSEERIDVMQGMARRDPNGAIKSLKIILKNVPDEGYNLSIRATMPLPPPSPGNSSTSNSKLSPISE